VQERDSTARLLDDLPRRFSSKEVGEVGGAPQRAWELTGLVHLNTGRFHEALAIFPRLYQHMLAAQVGTSRFTKLYR
jgi:hypothetical protein